mmetsp:Transcript_81968/g.228470  ORF Transcript_81968/g.228470 Transcript_81968/m.228470 type:complete len:254 (-) Transcript_81968:517-1278(-)
MQSLPPSPFPPPLPSLRGSKLKLRSRALRSRLRLRPFRSRSLPLSLSRLSPRPLSWLSESSRRSLRSLRSFRSSFRQERSMCSLRLRLRSRRSDRPRRLEFFSCFSLGLLDALCDRLRDFCFLPDRPRDLSFLLDRLRVLSFFADLDLHLLRDFSFFADLDLLGDCRSLVPRSGLLSLLLGSRPCLASFFSTFCPCSLSLSSSLCCVLSFSPSFFSASGDSDALELPESLSSHLAEVGHGLLFVWSPGFVRCS